MKIFMGIDPGKAGGLAVICDSGKLIGLHHTPLIGGKDYDLIAMAKLLYDYTMSGQTETSYVVIEHVGNIKPFGRKQGATSMFTFGVGYGVWLGVLGATGYHHGLKWDKVLPQVWTRRLMQAEPKQEDKKVRALILARNLFPEWQPKLKKDEALADAVLLAEYARRVFY